MNNGASDSGGPSTQNLKEQAKRGFKVKWLSLSIFGLAILIAGGVWLYQKIQRDRIASENAEYFQDRPTMFEENNVDIAAGIREACGPEIAKHCASKDPNEGLALVLCLVHVQPQSELSLGCREYLVSAMPRGDGHGH